MHSSCKQRRHTLYRTQLWTVHCSKHGVDNAAGYELCGHDKNGLGCTWKKEILDTVVVVGLGGFCSKLLLCYAPMLSTTSYMYYALGWVLLCSINKLIMLGVITCNFQYTLLTDYKLPCDTCVHVLFVNKLSLSNGNNHRFAYLPRLGANATSCTGSKTIPTMLWIFCHFLHKGRADYAFTRKG